MSKKLGGTKIRRSEGGNAAPKVQLTIPIHHDINIAALELMANNSILNIHNDSITLNLMKKRMNAVLDSKTKMEKQKLAITFSYLTQKLLA